MNSRPTTVKKDPSKQEQSMDSDMGLQHSQSCSSLISLVQSWYLQRSISQAMPRSVLG